MLFLLKAWDPVVIIGYVLVCVVILAIAGFAVYKYLEYKKQIKAEEERKEALRQAKLEKKQNKGKKK